MADDKGLRASFDEMWPLLVRNRRMAQAVAYIAEHELDLESGESRIICDPDAELMLGMTIEAEEAAKALEETWLAAHNAAVHAEFEKARKRPRAGVDFEVFTETGDNPQDGRPAEEPMAPQPIGRMVFGGR